MKTVSVVLPRGLPLVELHTFADWHVGDERCNMASIEKQIAEVKGNENAYAICNGDLMNNAVKTSVSDCYAERMPPAEQLELLCKLLEPIKGKVLFMTQGNHEARTYRDDGIDLTAFAADKLGIYERYAKTGGVLFLRFGDQAGGRKESNGSGENRRVCYTLYITHGDGGGRKEGAKAIRLADMASIVDCDIYCHSHTHLPLIMKQSFFRIDVRNSAVANVEKLFVNTAAHLDYGGYGQAKEFKPTSKTNPVIYLSGTRKEFTARL